MNLLDFRAYLSASPEERNELAGQREGITECTCFDCSMDKFRMCVCMPVSGGFGCELFYYG